jgi:hypothetical protein
VAWREFVATLVDSLAWPAAIVVLVVLTRDQVRDLLGGSLRRLKLGPGGAELEWQELAAEVRVSSVRALPPGPADPDDAPDFSHLDELAERSPGEAIVQASTIVIGELRRQMQVRNVETPDTASPFALVKAAVSGGAITRETGEALRGMLVLRDLAARDMKSVSVEKAVDYIVLARAVLYPITRD